jgi:hypothetical protein
MMMTDDTDTTGVGGASSAVSAVSAVSTVSAAGDVGDEGEQSEATQEHSWGGPAMPRTAEGLAIMLLYAGDAGAPVGETVWVRPVEGDRYALVHPPLTATALNVGDIVRCDPLTDESDPEDGGETRQHAVESPGASDIPAKMVRFAGLVEASGFQAVRLRFPKGVPMSRQKRITHDLVWKHGCSHVVELRTRTHVFSQPANRDHDALQAYVAGVEGRGLIALR